MSVSGAHGGEIILHDCPPQSACNSFVVQASHLFAPLLNLQKSKSQRLHSLARIVKRPGRERRRHFPALALPKNTPHTSFLLQVHSSVDQVLR